MARKKHVLHFSPNFQFAHRAWELNLEISREELPVLCEELHFLIQERHGMAHYYPQLDDGANVCRYEWTRKWRNSPVGLHLGILLRIGKVGVEQCHVYVTTNEAIAGEATIPDFQPKFEERLFNECVETIGEAVARTAQDRQTDRNVIFYMKVHAQATFGTRASTSDGAISIYPSTLIDGEIVSAVCVSVSASSNARAKPNALDQFGLLCALLTLAQGTLFDSVSLKWPKRRNQPEFLNSADAEPDQLYPIWKKPPVLLNARMPERLELIHDAFNRLAADKAKEFSPALYAYYSAERLQGHPTVEMVALLAALASLTSSRKEKCPGTLSCSQCGGLSWKHDVVGERLAITELVAELMPELSDKEKERVRNVIARAYSKQRSGFVHTAKLRHEEYYEGYGLPKAFPTATEPVRDVFFFHEDWASLKRITRRALLVWLENESGVSLCRVLPDATGEKVTVKSAMEGTITLPPNRVVAPFVGMRQPEEEQPGNANGEAQTNG